MFDLGVTSEELRMRLLHEDASVRVAWDGAISKWHSAASFWQISAKTRCVRELRRYAFRNEPKLAAVERRGQLRRGWRRLKRNVELAKTEREELTAQARRYLHHWRAVTDVFIAPLQTGAQSYALHKWVALTLAPAGPSYPWPTCVQTSTGAITRVRRYLRGTLRLSKRRKRLLEHATALSDVFALRVVFTTWCQFHEIVRSARSACDRACGRLAMKQWHAWAAKQVRVRGTEAHLYALCQEKLQRRAFQCWLTAKFEQQQCKLAETMQLVQEQRRFVRALQRFALAMRTLRKEQSNRFKVRRRFIRLAVWVDRRRTQRALIEHALLIAQQRSKTRALRKLHRFAVVLRKERKASDCFADVLRMRRAVKLLRNSATDRRQRRKNIMEADKFFHEVPPVPEPVTASMSMTTAAAKHYAFRRWRGWHMARLHQRKGVQAADWHKLHSVFAFLKSWIGHHTRNNWLLEGENSALEHGARRAFNVWRKRALRHPSGLQTPRRPEQQLVIHTPIVLRPQAPIDAAQRFFRVLRSRLASANTRQAAFDANTALIRKKLWRLKHWTSARANRAEQATHAVYYIARFQQHAALQKLHRFASTKQYHRTLVYHRVFLPKLRETMKLWRKRTVTQIKRQQRFSEASHYFYEARRTSEPQPPNLSMAPEAAKYLALRRWSRWHRRRLRQRELEVFSEWHELGRAFAFLKALLTRRIHARMKEAKQESAVNHTSRRGVNRWKNWTFCQSQQLVKLSVADEHVVLCAMALFRQRIARQRTLQQYHEELGTFADMSRRAWCLRQGLRGFWKHRQLKLQNRHDSAQFVPTVYEQSALSKVVRRLLDNARQQAHRRACYRRAERVHLMRKWLVWYLRASRMRTLRKLHHQHTLSRCWDAWASLACSKRLEQDTARDYMVRAFHCWRGWSHLNVRLRISSQFVQRKTHLRLLKAGLDAWFNVHQRFESVCAAVRVERLRKQKFFRMWSRLTVHCQAKSRGKMRSILSVWRQLALMRRLRRKELHNAAVLADHLLKGRVLSRWKKLVVMERIATRITAQQRLCQRRVIFNNWVDCTQRRQRQRQLVWQFCARKVLRKLQRSAIDARQLRLRDALSTWRTAVKHDQTRRLQAVRRLQRAMVKRTAWAFIVTLKKELRLRRSSIAAEHIGSRVLLKGAWARWRWSYHYLAVLKRCHKHLHDKTVLLRRRHYFKRWVLFCRLDAQARTAKAVIWRNWRNLLKVYRFRRYQNHLLQQHVIRSWQRLVLVNNVKRTQLQRTRLRSMSQSRRHVNQLLMRSFNAWKQLHNRRKN